MPGRAAAWTPAVAGVSEWLREWLGQSLSLAKLTNQPFNNYSHLNAARSGSG